MWTGGYRVRKMSEDGGVMRPRRSTGVFLSDSLAPLAHADWPRPSRSNVHADEAKQPKGSLTQENSQLYIFIPKIQLRFLSISELVYMTIIISSLSDSPCDQIIHVIM